MKKNAKVELIDTLNKNGFELNDIKYARILYYDDGFVDVDDEDNEVSKEIILNIIRTNEDVEAFLNDLDFEYDNSYGIQYFDGFIWLKDDTTWFSRCEYDGLEWWEYNKMPEIPYQTN
jgi:hypothetical protein